MHSLNIHDLGLNGFTQPFVIKSLFIGLIVSSIIYFFKKVLNISSRPKQILKLGLTKYVTN